MPWRASIVTMRSGYSAPCQVQDDPLGVQESLRGECLLVGPPGLQPVRMGTERERRQVPLVDVRRGTGLRASRRRFGREDGDKGEEPDRKATRHCWSPV